MTRDVPMIARMIIIDDVIINSTKQKTADISYYNYELDSESDYCANTTAWD